MIILILTLFLGAFWLCSYFLRWFAREWRLEFRVSLLEFLGFPSDVRGCWRLAASMDFVALVVFVYCVVLFAVLVNVYVLRVCYLGGMPFVVAVYVG